MKLLLSINYLIAIKINNYKITTEFYSHIALVKKENWKMKKKLLESSSTFKANVNFRHDARVSINRVVHCCQVMTTLFSTTCQFNRKSLGF